MGTGWRRAFCNTVPRDKREVSSVDKQQQSPSPKLAGSNPTTPRLRCKTTSTAAENGNNVNLVSPQLESKTTTPKSHSKSPRNLVTSSNPSSPRSPFSILKNTLRLSRSSCGVCMQSVKSGQRTAIYTAECSHVFHFPCITTHVARENALICPVCSTIWKDIPFLSIHKKIHNQESKDAPGPKYSTKSKNYTDDEPLVTPKATVPVAKEAIEDGIEEFRGFLVNPISSSDESFALNRNSRNVAVSLLPEAAVISVGRTHLTYAAVLKVKAPPPPNVMDPARRAPIDLVTVLDVSLSMSGAKLEMLKRAMRLVVSSLGSSDRLSIVAFSSTPKRLLPLMRMNAEGQRLARLIIDRLACSQGTSMAEALKQATKVLEDRRDRNPVASIILLSDGQDETVPANKQSNQRHGSPHVASTRFAHVEIPVNSSGFSREPAEDAFSKCVGELLSVVVQDLTIHLDLASGSDPAEITAVYSGNGPPTVFSPGFIRIGDLYAEEEREFFVEIRVPTSTIGSQHQHHVFSVKSNYRNPSNQDLINGREHALLVPRPQTVGSGLLKIQRLRNNFISTRAVAESRRLIEHNEESSALALLSSARALLLQSRSEAAGEFVRVLEAEMAEVLWRRHYQRQVIEQQHMGLFVEENVEQLVTPRSAWRAAEKLANSVNRVGDLHGFENARF